MIDTRFFAASREHPDAAARVTQAEQYRPDYQVDVHVGQRLRKRRMELRISQGALGRQLGLTFSQVQKYEKGTNRIGAGRLYHLAALLGVPVEYFFDGLEFEQPETTSVDNGSASKDAQRMNDLFFRISDPSTRQALISLASSMASA